MAQHVREVQELLKWLDHNYVSCKVIFEDGTAQEDEKFIPQKAVKSKFRENGFAIAEALRNAVLPQSDRHRVAPEAIAEGCAIVSCILLNLKQSRFLPFFLRDDDLLDKNLPFHTKPEGFPIVYPEFFDDFRREQRKFFAQSMRHLNDTKINDEHILPFVRRKTIAGGGSARIDKVTIHEDYDQLERETEQGFVISKAHQYAIKTYEGPGAESYYKREVEAFNRLREHNKRYPSPNIVGYHGSYIHRGTYNVILEYADGGTLEDYFKTQREPKSGQDIIDFWEHFFEVVKAIVRLHEQSLHDKDPLCETILHGWHQDIKPNNILVFRTADSPYKWTFKLADLGLSHFKAESAAKTDVVALDLFGTKTYGPPECYAWSEFHERQRLYIKKHVDIWSFGCVCSETVVWLVNGYEGPDGLEDYRRQRLLDTDKIENFRGGNCFHNAQDVRKSVLAMHGRVGGNIRNSDKITGLVLNLVNMMLRAVPEYRPHAKMLLYEVEVAIKNGKASLQAANTRASPRDGSRTISGQWRPPSGDSQPSPSYRPERYSDASQDSGQQGFFPGSPRKYVRSPRETISGSNDLEGYLTRNSPEELNDDVTRGLDRLSLNRAGSNHPADFEHDHGQSAFLQRSRSERTKQGTGISFASGIPYTEPSGIRKSPTSKQKNLYGLPFPNHSEHGGQFPAESAHWQPRALGDRIGPSPRARQEQIHDPFVSQPHRNNMMVDEKLARDMQARYNAEDQQSESQFQVPGGQPSGGPRTSRGMLSDEAAESKKDPKSTRLIHREKIPYLSVAAAVNWRRSRGRVPLDDASYLSYLNDRDHLFLVDDSASMKPYWNELIALLDPLIYMTKSSDPDGVELYFMTDQRKKQSKNSSDLVNLVRQVKPQKTVDARIRLGTILHTHLGKIQASCLATPSFSFSNPLRSKSARQARRVRGLNIYVMTTGEWQPECEVDDQIKSLVERLAQYNLPAAPIGIQFIRFGDSAMGKRRLQRLDDELNLKDDVVDTERSGGNVWKMLLGSINSWFDNDQED